MNDSNFIAVIDALGAQLDERQRRYKRVVYDCNELHEKNEEARRIIGGLEAEIREKEAVIEDLKKACVRFTPCVKCACYTFIEEERTCARFGLTFPDGTIDPQAFGCPFAEKREAADA